MNKPAVKIGTQPILWEKKTPELMGPLALRIDPVIQKVKEVLWLLAIWSCINDEPVASWSISSTDVWLGDSKIAENLPPLFQDYFQLIRTLEGNPIAQSTLFEGLSIGLAGLLRMNGYRVVFRAPTYWNLPVIQVIKIENIDLLPRWYQIIQMFPWLDLSHAVIDTILRVWKLLKVQS